MSTDMKRKFQGIWIPAAIWLDRSLSITEKVMLVEINSLESSDRGCFASNEYFSEFFDLSKSRVSEIISSLSKKDLVLVELIREGKQIVGRQIWMTENGRLLTAGVPPSEKANTSSENTHTPLRKTRRPSSEKAATLFGKGGDPSSEKAIESNTDSNNTKSNTDKVASSTSVIGNPDNLAPDISGTSQKKSSGRTNEVWDAYNNAYFNRYGTNAVRNRRVNAQIADFIDRVGAKEAPHIAAFYVGHNERDYIKKSHPIGLLVINAEGLRTQWATGRTMTASRAAQIDSTATNADSINEAIEIIRRRKENATI